MEMIIFVSIGLLSGQTGLNWLETAEMYSSEKYYLERIGWLVIGGAVCDQLT